MSATIAPTPVNATDRHTPMAEWCLDHGYTSGIAARWAADAGQDWLGLELARSVRSLEEARVVMTSAGIAAIQEASRP